MEVVQRVQEHQGLGDLQQYLGCLRHTRSVALQKKICYEKIFVQVSKIRKYNNLGRRAIFSYEDNIYETQINNNSETGCGWLCCIKLCGPSYQFPQNYATQLRSVCRDCCCGWWTLALLWRGLLSRSCTEHPAPEETLGGIFPTVSIFPVLPFKYKLGWMLFRSRC